MLDCGHEPSPHSSCSTGTCRLANGAAICWECSHKLALFYLGMQERTFAYLSGWSIVDWPGQPLMRVVSRTPRRNPLVRGGLVHVRAVDEAGNVWYGDGLGDGMYIRLRRKKGG